MLQAIYKKLQIAEHEQSRVKMAWSLRLFYQIGFVVSWTIITALFVEKFGIGNLLWLFLIDAVLFLGGTIVISFFANKIKSERFLLGTVFFTLLFIALAFHFKETEFGFFVFALLAKDLFFARINMALHRQTEELFSPAEAQKYIPIIDSAITIGSILGAGLLIQLLHFFPEQAVLGLWAASVAGIGILTFFMPKLLHFLPRFESEPESESRKNELVEAGKNIKKHHFLRNLLFLVLFQTILFTFIEVEFTREVQHEIAHEAGHHEEVSHFDLKDLQASLFTDAKEKMVEVGHATKEKAHEISSGLITHEKLAHDLGMFHLIFSVIALVVQLFITSSILSRIGVVGSMITYFLCMLVGSASLIFGVGNIQVLRGLQHGFHSIGEVPYHLTFYSLFSRARESVRLFFQEFLVPMGVIISVGVLFILPHEFLFPAMLMAAFGAILAGVLMKKNFTHHSVKNLQSENNIEEKLHHIEILGQKGHTDAALVLAKELKNKNNHPVVREKIINTISQLDDPRVIHSYVEILLDHAENEEIKMQILESILNLKSLFKYWEDHAFGQHHLLDALKKMFQNVTHPHLKKLVVMNIFSQLPTSEVVPFFLETMKKADESLKSICLRSCTVFDDPDIVFYLRPYLMHPDPRIRGHAIIALWKFEEEKSLGSILIDLLGGDEDHKIAGIYASGEVRYEGSRENLQKFMDHELEVIRLHALIALAKLGDKESIPSLLKIILGDDVDLANKAYRMIHRTPKHIQEAIKKEIQMEVSGRVFGILKPQNISRVDHLSRLSTEAIEQLKQFYRLAERYDDVLMMEQVVPQR